MSIALGTQNSKFRMLAERGIPWLRSLPITRSDMFLVVELIFLAERETGMIFQNVTEIAEALDQDRSNLSKAVKRLIEAKVLHKEREYLRISTVLIHFPEKRSDKKARKDVYWASRKRESDS